MMNQKSFEVIAKRNFGERFAKPIYDTYGFAQIPSTIERLLGGKKEGLPSEAVQGGPYDIVLLFLIDGFGWNLFQHYLERPFLRRFCEKGVVSKLTSQFPSTTAAHITCINTGMEVGQSGIYEWFYFEPKVDAVIAPLLFSYAGDHHSGTLLSKGYSSKDLFPFTTIYQALEKENIPSFVFQHDNTADAPYSKAVFQGAQITPYTSLESGLKKLQSKLQEASRGYFYFYFGDIDAAAHRHGLASKEVAKAVEKMLVSLENFAAQMGDKKIAILLTADHGMIDIDPKATFYLNKKIPDFASFLQKNREGRPIVPAGSCRDFFIHARQEKIKEAQALLQEHLWEIAEVHQVEELIQNGFFGKVPPSKSFLDRVGNLVILPFGHNSVWWYEKQRFEQRFLGMHGGLSRSELEIPFAFLSLG